MTETSTAAPPRRTCALVLGMHRSGTSAVTRMISLIGAGLPKDLMAASASNEAGHWEPRALVELDDRMLIEGGSAWNDWRPFDPLAALGADRLAAYRNEIMRGIEDQFAGQTLFVLKDPRVSRFAPLYLDSLAALGIDAKVVLTSRHPLEVAGSLRSRDSMPRGYALRLWLRHDLDAEATTRNAERIVISYDSAMNEPDAAIARLRSLLGSRLTDGAKIDVDAARASVRPELRHHAEAASHFDAHDALRAWAETVQEAYAALERDAADEQAMVALDETRARFDEDVRKNGDEITYLFAEARRIRQDLGNVTRERNVMIDQAHEVEEALKGRVQALKDLDETFTAYRRRHIADLAAARRANVGGELPQQLSPWRTFNTEKRERIRRLRDDYIAVRNSPLFDAEDYLKTYPDVVATGAEPILHYLSHGSREGRRPSASVDPIECRKFFPELANGEGNLVLRLIALHAPKPLAK